MAKPIKEQLKKAKEKAGKSGVLPGLDFTKEMLKMKSPAEKLLEKRKKEKKKKK